MPRVLLDVDTGVDDACALLLAARHPDVDLLGVTCVAGNAPVVDVVRNTGVVLQACGRSDVAVATGADRPLLEPLALRGRHGSDGMGDLGWPAPETAPDPRPAVELLRDTLLAAASRGEPVTVVALAPLTNVALLLRAFPHAASGIGHLVVMGGAFGWERDQERGGVVGAAPAPVEFNVRQDPEAAAITLAAAHALGIPVTMYGLDVFFAPLVERAQASRLAAAGGRSSRGLAGRLVEYQCDRFGADAATIGDAGALCAVLEPSGATATPMRVEVPLGEGRGRTVAVAVSPPRAEPGGPVDDAGACSDGSTSTQRGARVSVVTAVDGPRYAALWLQAVG